MTPDIDTCPVCHGTQCENPSHTTRRPPSSNNGNGPHAQEPDRLVRLTPASHITPVPVRWLWEDRLALGTFALVGGREGIGKSLCVLTLASDLTRGRLAGIHAGQPKAVIIAATEDSWEHTIVPRLIGADADLSKIYRVDVATTALGQSDLSLPGDLPALEGAVAEVGAALIILDPLLSRLHAKLDSHKDAEVRTALEPIVTLAGRTGCAVVGLIHVNKSGSQDALTSLMGSRAFAAVARSVLFVMKDPEQEHIRLLGLAKNNLGRSDLPTRSFTITGVNVAPQGAEAIWTGKLDWSADEPRSLRDLLSDATQEDRADRPGAVTDAKEWLSAYLAQAGGTADSNIIRHAGAQAGHSKDSLYRAKHRLRLLSAQSGSPPRAFWSVPNTPNDERARA